MNNTFSTLYAVCVCVLERENEREKDIEKKPCKTTTTKFHIEWHEHCFEQ